MIVDVHTHFFRPATDFGPALLADMARCGVDPGAWADVGERHLETTLAADVAVVFGLQARATGWNIPNDGVAAHVARAPERLLFFAAIDPAAVTGEQSALNSRRCPRASIRSTRAARKSIATANATRCRSSSMWAHRS